MSFEAAIAATQDLLSQLEDNSLSELAIAEQVTGLVASESGIRGFFVSYLTDERSFADHPGPGIMEALKTSAFTGEYLVKNLAMATAMALTHQQSHNLDLMANSQRVSRRSAQLIEGLQLPEIQTKLMELQSTLASGQGSYQTFLQRWGYDPSQKQAIQLAVTALLNPKHL